MWWCLVMVGVRICLFIDLLNLYRYWCKVEHHIDSVENNWLISHECLTYDGTRITIIQLGTMTKKLTVDIWFCSLLFFYFGACNTLFFTIINNREKWWSQAETLSPYVVISLWDVLTPWEVVPPRVCSCEFFFKIVHNCSFYLYTVKLLRVLTKFKKTYRNK